MSAQIDRKTGLIGNTAIKIPCKAATTANITLSGEQTIDGVSCVSGDRVLVKEQTDGKTNGVYEVDTGTWTRAPDFDGNNDVVRGTVVPVYSGSGTYALYVVQNSSVTIGTTSIVFEVIDDVALAANLANITDTALGDALVGGKRTEIGAVAFTQHDANQDRGFSLSLDANATGDGTANDTAEFQAAAIALSGDETTLRLASGKTYLVNDEITFGSSNAITIEGDGLGATIQIGPDFTNKKKLFIFPGASGARIARITLKNIRIVGQNDEDVDPIGIYAPFSHVAVWDNVDFHAIRNTAIFATQTWDLKASKIRAFGCGWADPWKDISSATFSITASDTTLTASASVFAAGDVGKVIVVAGAGVGGAYLKTTIASFTSATEVELTDAASTTVSGEKASFGPALGAVTASDATLTSDAAIFQASDVSRRIYLVGADISGGVLCTTIASFTSSTEVELTDSPLTSGTFDIIWAPAVFIGRPAEDASSGNDNTNAVKMEATIERSRAIGLLLKSGSNIQFDGKVHGAAKDNPGFGVSQDLIVVDSISTCDLRGELSYGFRSQIRLIGGKSMVKTSCIHGVIDDSAYPWYFDTGIGTSRLIIGDTIVNANRSTDAVFLGSTNNAADIFVVGNVAIGDAHFSGARSLLLQAQEQKQIVTFRAPSTLTSNKIIWAMRPALVWGNASTDNTDYGLSWRLHRVDISTTNNAAGAVGTDETNHWKLQFNNTTAADSGDVEDIIIDEGLTNTRNTTMGESGESVFEQFGGFSKNYSPAGALRARLVQVGTPATTPADVVVTVVLRMVRV